MSREHFVAGIGGYRPDLTYSPVDDRCSARFPGYDQPIALLSSNTVDAVLTSKGMLVYQDSKGEVRALQLTNHEPIYQAAVAANEKERDVQKSAVTGMPFSQVMGRHTGGMVSTGNIKITNAKIADAVIPHLDSTKISAGTIHVSQIAEGKNSSKKDMEKMLVDVVQEYIVPLIKNVQSLTAMNLELASRVKEMEKRLKDQATSQPVALAEDPDLPIREVSWGDQGGLPNFLHPQGNPFSGKRRG